MAPLSSYFGSISSARQQQSPLYRKLSRQAEYEYDNSKVAVPRLPANNGGSSSGGGSSGGGSNYSSPPSKLATPRTKVEKEAMYDVAPVVSRANSSNKKSVLLRPGSI